MFTVLKLVDWQRGDNFRLGVRSFVDGIWLHDTTVTFNLLPPFLKLSGLYKVANKTYDGNKNAQVSDITELIGIVDLPSPFNDSFLRWHVRLHSSVRLLVREDEPI